jgi:hypothetical protein
VSLEETTKFLEEIERLEQRKERCDHCRYWELDYSAAIRDRFYNEDDRFGECHRHAPSPAVDLHSRIGETLGSIAWATEEIADIEHYDEKKPSERIRCDYEFADKDLYKVWQWPNTRACEWCGDFQEWPAELIAARDAFVSRKQTEEEGREAGQGTSQPGGR